jgi:glyoxylase-like metal-dependent hydrolase (beta-lactamase superfamily II)
MQPMIQATSNPLVVDMRRERILVDNGWGEKFVPSFGSFPGLEAKLRRAGIMPETIDLVVTLHGHVDHIGGLVSTWCATPDPENATLRAITQPALVVSAATTPWCRRTTPTQCSRL